MTTATDPMTTPTATSSPGDDASPYAGDDASPYAVGSAPVVEEQRGFAISSLVLGLVSFVAGFTFVVPAAGLVLGILALKREPAARTMAIWGIVLNAVVLAGVAIAALATVAFGLFLLPFVPFAFI
ncbi:DUF4190 domain-containing protein [Agromyces sp. C10]|uniref:DUF4190 domain-containing protein n=1 Tax=Agromyces sp. C10 TaxID=2935077 RepID=UPI00200B0F85|nr:DUF4190 domain-containing protein [Agromyces sp. C10]MCK8610457.1 DUF4190 domain-containing protein [Agromyces sp. C10]